MPAKRTTSQPAERLFPGADDGARRELEARLEEAEAELRRLAFHDPLTGLPNRSQLDARLRSAVTRARRRERAVALLFVDLDDFKLVNDSFGHVAGDRLLRRVATRLSGVEEPGGLLARHGGDEFLVLLDDLDPETAEATRAGGRRRHRRPARQAVPDRRRGVPRRGERRHLAVPRRRRRRALAAPARRHGDVPEQGPRAARPRRCTRA